jgi:hypothetical protein
MQNQILPKETKKALLRLGARTIAYALLLGAISIGMLWGAVTYDEFFFDEVGPIEILETVFSLIAALIFLIGAKNYPQHRPCAISIATLLFCLVVRESDYLLDTLVGRHSWKIIVSLILVFFTFYLIRLHRQALLAIIDFVQRPSFGIFISGVLVLFVFSRLFGYGPFWQAIMDDPSYRTVKTIVEEGVELMGYFLILISSIEYFHDLRVSKSSPSRHSTALPNALSK